MKVEEMTGYRQPSSRERTAIQKIVRQDLNRHNTARGIWSAALSVICGASLWNAYEKFKAGDSKEMVNAAVVALISGALLFIFRYYSMWRKNTWRSVMQSDVSVMDCKACEASMEPAVDLKNMGGIKICNRKGQQCSDWMMVDEKSCRESMQGNSVKYLLIRCGSDQKNNYYKVVSESMIEDALK
ncbi:MAG: hypothetical protein Q4B01_05105 [Eubacteriales bacterium]|nr:hypothetical protein [Eubacteriales bacterium]